MANKTELIRTLSGVSSSFIALVSLTTGAVLDTDIPGVLTANPVFDAVLTMCLLFVALLALAGSIGAGKFACELAGVDS